MRRLPAIVLSCGLLLAATAVSAEARWQEGEHYFLIRPAQPKMDPAAKIEVIEAFSYGCPACFQFYPVADQLKASLPPGTRMQYLPASFIVAESWPLFQRAFYAARSLGVVDKTHNAMFEAIWKTGELGIAYPDSNRLKNPPPSLEDVAKFYNRVAGVSREKFLAAANSFDTMVSMNRADDLMKAYQVDSTPTIVIDGKYRMTPRSAGGYDQLIELVKWLVAKESANGSPKGKP